MRAALIGLALFATALPAAAQQQPTPPVTTPERQVVRPSTVVVTPPPTPTPTAAPTGVSRVWAFSALELPDTGMSCVYITNMSLTPVRISARVVGQDGGPNPAADDFFNRQLGDFAPGLQRSACWTSNDRSLFREDHVSYWLIFVSSAPVAITGITSSNHVLVETLFGGTQTHTFVSRDLIAVDCARPAGFEFVCAVAAGRFPSNTVFVRPR